MNVIGVNGINTINSNQGYKKNSHQQNFGQLIFTNAAARDSFAKKIIGIADAGAREAWKTWLTPHLSPNENIGSLITDGETTVKLLDKAGKLIRETIIGEGETAPHKSYLDLVSEGLRKLIPDFSKYTERSAEPVEKLVQKCHTIAGPVDC